MANILVVDDTAFMRFMLKNILETGGHTVISEAANGQEVIEKFKAFRPDAVTMNLVMPLMDGLEATREILKIDSKAKIIICSSSGQRHTVIEAMKRGAKDFIVKPFDGKKVVDAINEALSR